MDSGEKHKRRLRRIYLNCPRCGWEHEQWFDVTQAFAFCGCRKCGGTYRVSLGFDVSICPDTKTKPIQIAQPPAPLKIAATD